jgi:hypothetical protein
MSTTGRGGSGPQMGDEAIALLVVAVVVAGPIMAMLSGAGDGVATWLVAHRVLTRDDVLVPLAAEAGFDLARLVVGVGVLLGLLAWAVRVVQRRRAAERRPG